MMKIFQLAVALSLLFGAAGCASIYSTSDPDNLDPSFFVAETKPTEEAFTMIIRYPSTADLNYHDAIEKKLTENCYVSCEHGTKNRVWNENAVLETFLKTNSLAPIIARFLRSKFKNANFVLAPQKVFYSINTNSFQYENLSKVPIDLADFVLDITNFVPHYSNAAGSMYDRPFTILRTNPLNSPETEGLLLAHEQGLGALRSERNYGVLNGVGVNYLSFLNEDSRSIFHKSRNSFIRAEMLTRSLREYSKGKIIILPMILSHVKEEEGWFYRDKWLSFFANIINSIVVEIDNQSCEQCINYYANILNLPIDLDYTQERQKVLEKMLAHEFKFWNKVSQNFENVMIDGEFGQFADNYNELAIESNLNYIRSVGMQSLSVIAASHSLIDQEITMNNLFPVLESLQTFNMNVDNGMKVFSEGARQPVKIQIEMADSIFSETAISAESVQDLRNKFSNLFKRKYGN
ncbi:hypothetical protein ACD631_16210 [Alteromonas macleodii]|uniref:hypothetical protein n=1 Tax=Alteromonas macleodii TaxID=28108 RepID=UPI0036F467CF